MKGNFVTALGTYAMDLLIRSSHDVDQLQNHAVLTQGGAVTRAESQIAQQAHHCFAEAPTARRTLCRGRSHHLRRLQTLLGWTCKS